MSTNGADSFDEDERMQRARMVAQIRAQSRQTIEESEELAASLRARAPGPDVRRREAPPEPEPEPLPIAPAIASLRAEFETRLETSLESNRAFVQELLELLAGDFSKQWTAGIDDVAKTVSVEMRELRSDVARSTGRASGEVDALRSELGRSKVQIETLKAETEQLRVDLAKVNESLGQVWNRFGRLQEVRS